MKYLFAVVLSLTLSGCMFGGGAKCVITVTPKEIHTKVDSNACTVTDVPDGVLVTQKKK